MTKTSRTHCARPVKLTIQRLYAFQILFNQGQQKQEESYYAKVAVKLCLFSFNSTYAFLSYHKCRIWFYCFLIIWTYSGILLWTVHLLVTQRRPDLTGFLKMNYYTQWTLQVYTFHVFTALMPEVETRGIRRLLCFWTLLERSVREDETGLATADQSKTSVTTPGKAFPNLKTVNSFVIHCN